MRTVAQTSGILQYPYTLKTILKYLISERRMTAHHCDILKQYLFCKYRILMWIFSRTPWQSYDVAFRFSQERIIEKCPNPKLNKGEIIIFFYRVKKWNHRKESMIRRWTILDWEVDILI